MYTRSFPFTVVFGFWALGTLFVDLLSSLPSLRILSYFFATYICGVLLLTYLFFTYFFHVRFFLYCLGHTHNTTHDAISTQRIFLV
ncbi:hypothetical protein B0H14DRAFT_1451300 [Mycena olivaceomarginata]|nr:hypothetical protein B0H14DRAFT_1451300 [Mycena olivaceomarginata]